MPWWRPGRDCTAARGTRVQPGGGGPSSILRSPPGSFSSSVAWHRAGRQLGGGPSRIIQLIPGESDPIGNRASEAPFTSSEALGC
eukprot:767146-Hanusia_phi.AAC.6